MKMTVLWDVEPCSLVEVYRRFQRCILPPSSGCRVSVRPWLNTDINIVTLSGHVRETHTIAGHFIVGTF
jgi:hypothetical protein